MTAFSSYRVFASGRLSGLGGLQQSSRPRRGTQQLCLFFSFSAIRIEFVGVFSLKQI